MQTIWQFKINGTEVEEPIGWDAVEFTLQRDEIFQGLENVFSDNIVFWDNGAQLIKEAYELDGVDAELNFEVNYSCDGGITFVNQTSGILNAFFYEIKNNEVKIKLEPSGFHRKVKNRLTTPINLLSNISVGGSAISSIDPFDLGLHSKAIILESKQLFDLGTYSEDYIPVPSTDTLYVSLPVDFIEYEGLTVIRNAEPPIIYSLRGPTTFVNPNYTNSSAFDLEVQFDYSFIFKLHETFAINRSYNLALIYKLSTTHDPTIVGGTTTIHNYGPKSLLGSGDLNQTVNEVGSFTITVPVGYSVHFYFVFSNFTNNPSSPETTTITFNTVTSFFIKYKATSIVAPSSCKAFLIHEAFAKISESITDQIDSFRSNYFGRTNSSPNTYDSDGCGAWIAITNGLNIRKMKDKNNVSFPIIMSFQELFEAANSLKNLGMRIEKDEFGKEFIRVEPKDFFFNATAGFNIFNISDLTKKPAQEQIFNTFNIGYEKWNLNISGINGLDEFNSKRNYSIPVVKSNKNLNVVCKFIASGYLIEQCRRVQFQSNPTNDFELDNDNFFICTNRDEITSDLYTTPAVSTVYPAGTISERNENFSSISNVLSPETCYNLRVSPIRNAQNWYDWISASIFKHPDVAIKFISGDGNYQEQDTMINGCIVGETVEQNQNLLASDLTGVESIPIYLPEVFEFTYPLSFSDFILLVNNSEKGIQISCNSEGQFIGFIKELKFSPNAEGNNASFILISGRCLAGDFNDDFNLDFLTIGSC